ETATLTGTGANAVPTTATVTLSGTGIPPIVIVAAPPKLSFSPITVGSTTASQTVTISNMGTKTANGVTLTLAGPYQLDQLASNTCISNPTLGPHSSCTANVVF